MRIMKKSKVDAKYLRMAQIWSENSHAIRKKVGCIIVKDKRIISDGYNGTPTGFENKCEDTRYVDEKRCRLCERDHCEGCDNIDTFTKPYVLHAEANAITELAKSTNSSEGATLYVTCSPCFDCAKLIIQAGIKHVYYLEEYRDTKGLDLLVKVGVEVYKVIIKPKDDFCPDSDTCKNFCPCICDEHCCYEPNIVKYEIN